MLIEQYSLSFLGENCLCISLKSQQINLANHQKITALMNHIKSHYNELILDYVPSYQSLGLFFDSLQISPEKFYQQIEVILPKKLMIANQLSKTFYLQVDYNGEDLPFLASHLKLTIDQIIFLHSQAHYIVAAIGFMPHFPYLIGLDKCLHINRRQQVQNIKANSVAIGGQQTGIYPQNSPGGWYVIGTLRDSHLLPKICCSDKLIFQPSEV